MAFIGKEGKYAHAPQPDLIVMDLHLRKNDGMEVLEEIRRNAEIANLLVAVLSSSVSPEDKNNIARLSEPVLITKPLDLEGFMTVGTTFKRLSLEGKASAAGAAS